MYDSREKAILDYESGLIDARQEGRKEGRQEGRKEGEVIGRIRLLQELLDLPLSNQEELSSLSLEQLTSTMNDLQAKLRSREA